MSLLPRSCSIIDGCDTENTDQFPALVNHSVMIIIVSTVQLYSLFMIALDCISPKLCLSERDIIKVSCPRLLLTGIVTASSGCIVACKIGLISTVVVTPLILTNISQCSLTRLSDPIYQISPLY